MKRWGMVGAQLALLLAVNMAQAAGLGVQGDGFLTQFANWLPTLFFVAASIGILIWVQSTGDYGQGVLSGSLSWVTRGIIGGAAITILGTMGLTMGALLN